MIGCSGIVTVTVLGLPCASTPGKTQLGRSTRTLRDLAASHEGIVRRRDERVVGRRHAAGAVARI